MAELMFPDIGGSFREGQAFGTRQRLVQQDEQRRSGLSRLASQAYGAPQEQRTSLLSQMAALDPAAAAQQEQQFASGDDRRLQKLGTAARYLESARLSGDPAKLQGAWNATRPMLAQEMPDARFPDQWDDATMAPLLYQALAATGGTGIGGNVQSTYINADGIRMAIMRDGSQRPLGEAENRLQLRDQPGIAPGAFDPRKGTLAPVNEVGAPRSAPASAPPAAPPNVTIDPSLPPEIQADIRANPQKWEAASTRGQATGQIEPGNIDLNSRPIVRNPDGSISTVRSMSVNIDGQEVLIPTVSDDGRVLSDQDAIAEYQRTGRHLGKFSSPEAATRYAEQLHQSQAAQYVPRAQQAAQPSPTGVAAARPEMNAGETERLRLAQEANRRAEEAANIAAYTRQLGNAPAGFRFKPDGTLEPIPGGPKPAGATATEDERKASGWVNQARNAFQNMEAALRDDPNANEPGIIESYAPIEELRNRSRSDARQRYVNGASSFSEAALRAATGAGVNKEEAEQKIRELTPQRGDTPGVRQQKRSAMEVYLKSLEQRAGRALQAVPGAPAGPTAGTVQDGYRFRGGNPADPNSWERI